VLLLAVPPSGVPYLTQRTLLSGVDFELTWAWNSRTDTWALNIAALGDGEQENPTPVLTGAKVFIGFDLLRRCRHPKRPLGSLWAYSADGSYLHPGQNDLGTRVNIVYLEPGEGFDA
jgi:hypothetical protein